MTSPLDDHIHFRSVGHSRDTHLRCSKSDYGLAAGAPSALNTRRRLTSRNPSGSQPSTVAGLPTNTRGRSAGDGYLL
jgi:hypothetical protein